MNPQVLIEFDPETNSYSAACPDLPGCEARANLEEAIRLYLR